MSEANADPLYSRDAQVPGGFGRVQNWVQKLQIAGWPVIPLFRGRCSYQAQLDSQGPFRTHA